MDYRHGLWMMLTTWTTRKTMELTILLLKVIVSPFLLALSNVSDVSLPLKVKRGRSLRQAGNSSFISIPRNKEIWPCINLWQFIAQQKVPLNFQSNVPKMAPKVRQDSLGIRPRLNTDLVQEPITPGGVLPQNRNVSWRRRVQIKQLELTGLTNGTAAI